MDGRAFALADRPQDALSSHARRLAPEPYKYNLDPLDVLTFAAVTTKIRLGPSVLDIPYYNPVTLARRLSTIDILSKGRRTLAWD